MSRYVDIEGDWVDDAVKAYSLGYYDDDEYAIPFEALGSAPSIDIVHCKDCKHVAYKINPVRTQDVFYGCHYSEIQHDGDFYCAYGERIDNE